MNNPDRGRRPLLAVRARYRDGERDGELAVEARDGFAIGAIIAIFIAAAAIVVAVVIR